VGVFLFISSFVSEVFPVDLSYSDLRTVIIDLAATKLGKLIDYPF
jgi:hypothetical protein